MCRRHRLVRLSRCIPADCCVLLLPGASLSSGTALHATSPDSGHSLSCPAADSMVFLALPPNIAAALVFCQQLLLKFEKKSARCREPSSS